MTNTAQIDIVKEKFERTIGDICLGPQLGTLKNSSAMVEALKSDVIPTLKSGAVNPNDEISINNKRRVAPLEELLKHAVSGIDNAFALAIFLNEAPNLNVSGMRPYLGANPLEFLVRNIRETIYYGKNYGDLETKQPYPSLLVAIEALVAHPTALLNEATTVLEDFKKSEDFGEQFLIKSAIKLGLMRKQLYSSENAAATPIRRVIIDSAPGVGI